MLDSGKNYIVTTDNFFICPDGRYYGAVYGNVQIIDKKEALGKETMNRYDTSWYARVGTEDNHVIVAGCQIKYAVRTDNPNLGSCMVENLHEGQYRHDERKSVIYDASKEVEPKTAPKNEAN